MIDRDRAIAHLTDEDIDAYWQGTLTASEEERVEQHYLDCAGCERRVHLVETLSDALRANPTRMSQPPANVRAWQATAAVMATLVVVIGWMWAGSLREARQRNLTGETLSLDTARTAETALSTLVGPLSPPTRDASAVTVTPAGDTPIVVFAIDAREAGPPGSRFDVSLANPAGDVVLRVRQVISTNAGTVLVPVHRSVLGPGPFLFEVAAGATTVAVPVVIQSPGSR